MDWEKLAEKVVKGLATGKVTNQSMGLTSAEIQALRRLKDEDGSKYSNDIYICKNIYEKVFLQHKKATNENAKIMENLPSDATMADIVEGKYIPWFKPSPNVSFSMGVCSLLYQIKILATKPLLEAIDDFKDNESHIITVITYNNEVLEQKKLLKQKSK